MKKYLRRWFKNSVTLALLANLYPGFEISDNLKGIIISGLVLTLINLVARPILKTILLPINLITLGAIRWIINTINLAILSYFTPQANFNPFFFQGINYAGISIQSLNITILPSIIIGSIIYTSIKKIIVSVLKSK